MFDTFAKGRRTNDIVVIVLCAAFLIFFAGFVITQVNTCVTCDGVVMKTMWDTFVCVDESAIQG